MKEFLKKKWVKVVFIILIVAVIGIFFGKKEPEVSYRTTKAFRGNVSATITGSGTLKASEARSEISKVSSTVESVFFEEGDRVEKGDVIAKLDSSDYEMNIKSQKNAIKQAELTKSNLDRQVKNLKIVSPTDGYVSNLNVMEGNYIVTNSQICEISNSQKYEVTLQFSAALIEKVQVGNTAKVLLTNSLSQIDGTVSFVSDKITTLQSGATVTEITIEIADTSYALSGVSANAEIITPTGVYKSANSAAFNSKNAGNIKAETAGTISKLYVKNGQYVRNGEIIAELVNNDLTTNAQSAALNLQNLYDQLSYAQDKLEDYKVIAPINGVITAQTIKAGDTVALGTVLSTISNREEMEFKIPVDELDIARLDYDKKVNVTIDALEYTQDTPLVGRISKLPLEGSTTGGVTDYYVTISFSGQDDIRISMNADAEIIIDERNDVVCIPVEALQKEEGETIVYVLKDGVKEARKITTGLKDLSYVEVKEGIEVGEEVIIPEQKSIFNFM